MLLIRKFTITTAPPSVNAQKAAVLVKGKPRLIKTKEYRRWIARTEKELMAQKGFSGTFIWSSDIQYPCNSSRMDIDNAPKALHDILVQCRKVPDDRYLSDSRIRWAKGSDIIVTVYKEELNKWIEIKKLSPPTIKKLAL